MKVLNKKHDRNAIRFTAKGWTLEVAKSLVESSSLRIEEPVGQYRVNQTPLRGKTCVVVVRKRKTDPLASDWPQQLAKQIRIYKNPIVQTY